MKTQVLILTTVALLAFNSENKPLTFSFNSQPTVTSNQVNDFSFFRVHRQGKDGVTATWAYAGAGLTGFTLQRTYQDPTDPYSEWENIYSVETSTSETFKYTDAGVMAGVITYRVVAIVSGGPAVISNTADIRIVAH